MKTAIFDTKGKEIKKIDLPETVFEVKLNPDLLHDVVLSMNSNSRSNTAHTKDRREVSGGGKKPWRQKGLGRARHGSTRSPIWVGGGITFGPRNDKNYSRKINQKAKSLALAMVLSEKAKNNQIILLDSVEMKEAKTKEAKNIIDSIAKNKEFAGISKNKITSILLTSDKNEVAEKSFRNLPQISINTVANVNLVELLNNRYVIIENPEKSFEIFTNRIKVAKNNK